MKIVAKKAFVSYKYVHFSINFLEKSNRIKVAVKFIILTLVDLRALFSAMNRYENCLRQCEYSKAKSVRLVGNRHWTVVCEAVKTPSKFTKCWRKWPKSTEMLCYKATGGIGRWGGEWVGRKKMPSHSANFWA